MDPFQFNANVDTLCKSNVIGTISSTLSLATRAVTDQTFFFFQLIAILKSVRCRQQSAPQSMPFKMSIGQNTSLPSDGVISCFPMTIVVYTARRCNNDTLGRGIDFTERPATPKKIIFFQYKRNPN